jgi:hypothetical protein
VGAHALAAHGVPRATAARVVAALERFGAPLAARGFAAWTELARGASATLEEATGVIRDRDRLTISGERSQGARARPGAAARKPVAGSRADGE